MNPAAGAGAMVEREEEGNHPPEVGDSREIAAEFVENRANHLLADSVNCYHKALSDNSIR